MPADSHPALLPLADDKAALLGRLVEGLDGPTLQWLSGYMAGLAVPASDARHDAPAPLALALPSPRLTVLYGSQTGNSRRVAEGLVRAAENAGLNVRLCRADAYPLRELKSERLLCVIMSTHGEGDPPDDTRAFMDFIGGRRAPRLDDLRFAVLGLGDSSYARFCAVARQVDARLAELGATRIVGRADADVDVDAVAAPWQAAVLAAAHATLGSTPAVAKVTPLRPSRAAPWTRERPYAAEVLANQRITSREGARDVRHIELSLQDSGLAYEPGDAIGIWPTNSTELVDEVLATLRLDGDTAVASASTTLPLREWLANRRELTRVSRGFAIAHAARASADDLDAIIASPVALPRFLSTHQVPDLLEKYPASWDADELVAALQPLTPRLYSIASSPRAAEHEAHLTVAAVESSIAPRRRYGAASRFLAGCEGERRVPVYIEPNERFRLPRDASRDIIMIGPGTGVAPFRAFLQERTLVGAGGRNWLFFGAPHRRSDFLYQSEWLSAHRRGELQRLDVAFSRDLGHKTYVQHRLREHASDIFAWLEGGAHLYVCGDAARMAPDVHQELRAIVARHGGRNDEDAEAYLAGLAADRRYSRDVY